MSGETSGAALRQADEEEDLQLANNTRVLNSSRITLRGLTKKYRYIITIFFIKHNFDRFGSDNFIKRTTPQQNRS